MRLESHGRDREDLMENMCVEGLEWLGQWFSLGMAHQNSGEADAGMTPASLTAPSPGLFR